MASETSLALEIKKRYFYQIWKRKCRHIKIMQNGSDYCDYCTKYLADAKDDEGLRLLLEQHRALARQERENYLSQFSDTEVPHYTFDFAQSIHLPFLLRQPGSYYFRKGLLVRLFGICCETTKTQINYSIPEGSYPGENRSSGKDPNFVISILWHFLEHYNTKRNIRMHADSCAGQNKNQYVFHFLIWCVVIGKLDSVVLSFMLPGHTKAFVDAFFGIIKSYLKRFNIKTLSTLCEAIRNSCEGNHAHNCSEHTPEYFNWKAFLGQYFNPKGIPNIKKDVLIMEVSKRGERLIVRLKKDSKDEGTIWKFYLRRGMKLSQVRSEKDKLTEHRVDVLDMTKERKKYLLNLPDLAAYEELKAQLKRHKKRKRDDVEDE